MSLDQLKGASRQIKVENKRSSEIGNFKLKMMDTYLPFIYCMYQLSYYPEKNTQNRFGVFNCYQKNNNKKNCSQFQMTCLHMLPQLGHENLSRFLKKNTCIKINISVLENLQS